LNHFLRALGTILLAAWLAVVARWSVFEGDEKRQWLSAAAKNARADGLDM